MKSEQTMLVRFGVAVLLLVATQGCSHGNAFRTPNRLVSPYDATRGGALWAVVPLRNESGSVHADPQSITQTLSETLNQIEGVTCIPSQRTGLAMRELGLSAVNSPGEALTLAQALGANGVVVGSITAYDPYDPPTLGITLALHASVPSARSSGGSADLEGLRGNPVGTGLPQGTTFRTAPNAVASVTLNASNHAVRREVHRYADGRHDPTDALGWERYMASMDLFTEFAAHAAVARLLDQERLRLGGARRGNAP